MLPADAVGEWPLLCRFLDAGGTERSPHARRAGVQKAPGHEVAGSLGSGWAASAMGISFSRRIMMVGAKLAPGGLDSRHAAAGLRGAQWAIPVAALEGIDGRRAH